jgi:hypothetical protein
LYIISSDLEAFKVNNRAAPIRMTSSLCEGLGVS